MKIFFRADASIQIGAGHVMRCLTLAEELRRQGCSCEFICRSHEGHLGSLIEQKGFLLHLLPVDNQADSSDVIQMTESGGAEYASWLGGSWQSDAEKTQRVLSQNKVDWLVVDHYALDICWEKRLQECYEKLMVIDDLANREHACDLLLDQTYGRDGIDYQSLVPSSCQVLCGSKYALLRPEFAQWRDYSLKRREQGQLEHLLINLGGVDKDNITSQILKALANSPLPKNCRITVIMGATAPWVEEVKHQAAQLSWPTQVKVGVSNMAELMANCDLAVGAAGATSWERCCLGLPTIMVVLAENQWLIAKHLMNGKAVLDISAGESLTNNLTNKLVNIQNKLRQLSEGAAIITDGLGCSIVASIIGALVYER